MDHDDRQVGGPNRDLMLHIHLARRDVAGARDLRSGCGAAQILGVPYGAPDEKTALRLHRERALRVDRCRSAAAGG